MGSKVRWDEGACTQEIPVDKREGFGFPKSLLFEAAFSDLYPAFAVVGLIIVDIRRFRAPRLLFPGPRVSAAGN